MPAGATIRQFRWSDLARWSLLFSQLQAANPSDGPPDLEFARRYLSQPGCEPELNCYVAESDGLLVGYTLLAPELPIGRAVASGGVMPLHRGAGAGRGLLRKAVERARQLRVDVLHVQADESSEDEGHLLERLGFRAVREYWSLSWTGNEAPVFEVPPRFGLRAFQADRDEAVLTHLQNASFEGTWGFCPNTVEQIAARVSLRPWEAEGVLLLLDDRIPAAYNWTSRCSVEPGATGRISMTGVHPSYRGRGLGRTVLLAGIERLKRLGAGPIRLEVDSENTPAMKLYQSSGFQRVGRALWYELRFAG